MSVLTVVSPGIKALFERIGKPEIINQPEVLRLGGTGAVIACNHVGWEHSLWFFSLVERLGGASKVLPRSTCTSTRKRRCVPPVGNARRRLGSHQQTGSVFGKSRIDLASRSEK